MIAEHIICKMYDIKNPSLWMTTNYLFSCILTIKKVLFMNTLENQMVDLLKEMRERYFLTGVKGEFECEGLQLEEMLRLKEITVRAGVNLTIKIGGCEAITDMQFARSIGANQIVAPMIESAYSVKKFIGAAQTVFHPDEFEALDLLINIETVSGLEAFSQILALAENVHLKGLDIGRVDLAGSMNLMPEECNSSQVFNACYDICGKWIKAFPQKECTLGGYLNQNSILFLRKMAKTFPVGCESKKAIFSSEAVCEDLLQKAYIKAIELERLWYANCMDRYKWLSTKNWNYYKNLDRYEMSIRSL